MMEKENIKEIRRGSTGTGLLIECDGFIEPSAAENRRLLEDVRNDREEGFFCPKPFIVSAVFQKYGVENANGRIYPERILKREVDKYQEKIREKRAIGEANHPSDSAIDLSRVAINIIELHWEGNTLVGKLEIIISEGFRKYGVISCQGDQVANLLLNGIKIGVSSRGLGTVEKRMGTLYVSDDYEIVCWDVVSDPSTPNAWIAPEGKIPDEYIDRSVSESESIKEDGLRGGGDSGDDMRIRLDKFREWLNSD